MWWVEFLVDSFILFCLLPYGLLIFIPLVIIEYKLYENITNSSKKANKKTKPTKKMSKESEKEVLEGGKAQIGVVAVKYVTDLVTAQVTDVAVATKLNADITAKLVAQADAFAKAVDAEDNEADLTSDLLA